MSVSAGTVYLDVVPNLSGFTSTMQKTLGTLQKQLGGGLTAAATAGFAALGFVAVDAITKGIEATTEWASGVRELQRVTGQSAESASALLAVGERLGLDTKALTTGFGLLAKNIINVAPNLTKYGILVKDASGVTLPFDQILANVIDKFQTLPEGPQQAAFAMNVFGRSGKALIPLLQQGNEKLDELRQRAEELGLVMSQDDVDAAKALTIAQRELGSAVKGLSISIGREFLPIATKAVEIFTDMIKVLNVIPGPVKAVAFGFVVLTGAIAALRLVTGFFVTQWRAVGDLISSSATKITTGATQLTLFGEEATGAGLAAGGFGAAVAGIATYLVPAALLLGAWAWHLHDVKAAQEQFNAAVERSGLLLRSGGKFASGVRELAKQSDEQIRQQAALYAARVKANNPDVLEAGVLAGEYFRQKAAVDAARQALEDFRAEQEITTASAVKTVGALGDAFAGVDTSTLLIDVTHGVDLLNKGVFDATKGLGTLSHRSHQDFGGIRDDLLKTINDPKTAIADLPAAFGAAIASMKQTMRSWKADVADTFGGASAALEDFFGKSHVSFSKLTESLSQQRKDLRTWQTDFQTILKGGGSAAKVFLQDMSEQGLDSLGILESVANQPKKIRDQFLTQYKSVNKANSDLANSIVTAFGHVFDRILFQIKNMVRVFNGQPPLKFKTDTKEVDDAKDKLDDIPPKMRAIENQRIDIHIGTHDIVRASLMLDGLQQKISNIASQLASAIGSAFGGGDPKPKNGTAMGGIVSAPQIRLVGEAGPEAIVPLDEWDKHRVAVTSGRYSGSNNMRLSGNLRIVDWRQGIATLDGETAWESLVRTS